MSTHLVPTAETAYTFIVEFLTDDGLQPDSRWWNALDQSNLTEIHVDTFLQSPTVKRDLTKILNDMGVGEVYGSASMLADSILVRASHSRTQTRPQTATSIWQGTQIETIANKIHAAPKHRDQKAACLTALTMLSFWSPKNGLVYASREKLAYRVFCSYKTIDRGLAYLETHKFIVRANNEHPYRTQDGPNRNQTNAWRFTKKMGLS